MTNDKPTEERLKQDNWLSMPSKNSAATFIFRMIRMWLEFKEEKKDQEKKECNLV